MSGRLLTLLVGALAGVALLSAPSVFAGEGEGHAPSVRFYKLNKKGQQKHYMFLRNTEKLGCHKFSRSRPVHRFAQSGFAWCQLYSGKECRPEDLVQAMWDGRRYHQVEIDVKQPQSRLYEGSRWLLKPDGNLKIRSWRCEAEKEQ